MAALPGAVMFVQSADAAEVQAQFVGSEACRDCHESVYTAWRTTWHSFALRTADEARLAQLPLPPRANGNGRRAWSEVSAVFGGRNRLTYIDRDGHVMQPGFDVRLQRWDREFPNGRIESCWACHATGVGAEPTAASGYRAPGMEPTIGCEACHGPGGRHVETFEATDIVVDTGSASCGRCHTAFGRVLPATDAHGTHDLVQGWYRDAHVRGLADHSITAQCATCHSPADAPRATADDPGRLVLAEDKHDIGCPSCHDPHRMTNPVYARDRAPVASLERSALSVLAGRDGDFTTADHISHTDTESSCRACHRGADRVVLNHGDATCVDCHSAFHRSRTTETRVVEDPNHPGLSCRGCHDDGDHLLTIVKSDPRFLHARIVHDLGDIPEPAAAHYRLEGASPGTSGRTLSASATDNAQAVREPITLPDRLPLPGANPNDVLTAYVQRADEHAIAGDTAAAAQVLREAAALTDSALLLALPIERDSGLERDAPARESLDRLARQRRSFEPATGTWLAALAASVKRDPATVIALGHEAPAGERGLSFDVMVAFAEAARGNARAGVRLLEARADGANTSNLKRLALGLLELRRNRSDAARTLIDEALAADPDDAVAHYSRGLVLAASGDFRQAANAVARTVILNPQWRDAWLKLGYMLIRAQETNAALRILQGAASAWPGEYAVRYRLGSLYKLLADQIRYRLLVAREAPRPPRVALEPWRQSLGVRAGLVQRIAAMSHAEYTYAQQIEPTDHRTQWQRAEAIRIMGRDEDARALFQALALKEPNQWVLQYRLGLVNLKLSRPAGAVEALAAAHRVRPDQADVLGALGHAYLVQGEPVQAQAQLELARVFEPFNPAIHHNLGVALARRGASAAAERSWRRGLELGTFPLPRIHLTHFNLAVLYFQRGEADAARHELARALFAFPDYAPALALREALDSRAAVEPDFVLHEQFDMFGEISTVSGFDLVP